MSRLTEEHPELIIADILSPVIIRNNRFRCDRGWDIDLDDGSSCYDIYNNLLLNGGIKLREGFYRRVENNILVNNTLLPHVWIKNNGDVFRNNDVILKINGIPTDNVEELMQATSEIDKKRPVRVLVYRNQKQLEIEIPMEFIR